jgi:signal transduction histidine kinase
MLQFQDETGRIISSGHFRNEYDRMEPELPELLASTQEGTALVKARAPNAHFLALACVDSFQMGGKRFTIIAGVKVESRFLTRLVRETELSVSLVYPGGILVSGTDRAEQDSVVPPDFATATEIVRELNVPFIDSARGEHTSARIRVTHRLTELQTLRRSIDRWFMIAFAATGILAVLLASWLVSRISRPLVELADKTSRIDLDRLDIDFETHRKDEIGSLSRLLGAMTGRLRASAVRIKDAERRATLGELARQVNHDIKNGLIPIRNVFRHLAGLARDNPTQLPGVFNERERTIDSSISYLENLASNYARLYPRSERQPCDVNVIIKQVAEDERSSGTVDLRVDLSDRAVVQGDPLALRRIIENLVDNAIDSLESRPGIITVSTELIDVETRRSLIRITVSDTGIGMSEKQKDRVFDDFYTTKDDGTGLGLSIVRRLVMDLDGSIQVESEEGKGSRFIIELPAESSPSSS